jgi:hypothetical protein
VSEHLTSFCEPFALFCIRCRLRHDIESPVALSELSRSTFAFRAAHDDHGIVMGSASSVDEFVRGLIEVEA